MIGGTTILGVALMIRTHDFRWLFLSLPFSIMLVVAARYAPRSYQLAADGVHIERKAGPRILAYRDIRGVDRTRRPLKGLSFGGSNGLFGRFGRFWNPRLGVYRLFLSNTRSVVWLRTTDGWVGLSPERPEAFQASLEAKLTRAEPM